MAEQVVARVELVALEVRTAELVVQVVYCSVTASSENNGISGSIRRKLVV